MSSLLDLLPDALPQARQVRSQRAELLLDLAGLGPGKSFPDAVRLLPSARVRGSASPMFAGSKRRCAQKCKLMRESKRARQLERDNEALRRESQPLAGAWNSERMRFGDRVACDVGGVHPRQFPVASVLRDAWGQLAAKFARHDEGLDGTSRHLEILSVVASALATLQSKFVDGFIDDACRKRACPVIFKYYDATPKDVVFGMMAPQMAPWARYPVLIEGKWKSMSLDELREAKGSRIQPNRGVVDLLATGMECFYAVDSTTGSGVSAEAIAVDAAWEIAGLQALVPPQFLQRGNASSIYEATETSVPQFSSEGIRTLAEQCPFLVVCEVPDFCGSNGRKVMQSIQDVSALRNVFSVQGRCGAHQCFRIIQAEEKKCVGDVHAVIVSATHVHHAERLWTSFRSLLGEVQVFWGVKPLQSNIDRNRDIARHTFLRDAEFVVGDSVQDGYADTSWLERQDEETCAMMRFLDMYNGCWNSDRVQHFCHGCCPYGDVDAVVEKLYAAAYGIDLLCTKEKEPSLDDWGTAGRACGKIAGAIQCHELLPRSFVRALPRWSAMLPPSNDRSDGATQARIRIQKKTFRAFKTLTEAGQRKKLILMAYVTYPIERLQRELCFLDAAGNGIFDAVAFDDDLNMFLKCRRTLIDNLSSGKDGVFASLFPSFDENLHAGLLDEIRTMTLSFSSQVDWRFQEYKTWPRKLLKMFHPAATNEMKRKTRTEFFSTRKCCRRPESCDTIFDYFNGSADAMAQNIVFEKTMRTFAKKYRFTGMAMERLLALFRRVCNGRGRDRSLVAERCAAYGFLRQCLTAYDGPNPAFLSREKLLKDGVPLRCRVEEKSQTRRVGTFFTFKADKEKLRDQSLRGEEYYTWLRSISAEWKGVTGQERLQVLHQAHDDRLRKQRPDVDHDEPPAISVSKQGRVLRTFVDEFGDADGPVAEKHFESIVREVAELPAMFGGRRCEVPGLNSYSDPLRRLWRRKAYVEDMKKIPDSRKFDYTHPCSEVHMGFCRETDKGILYHAKAAADEIFHFVSDGAGVRSGTFWHMSALLSNNACLSFWMVLCHSRFSNPKINLLTGADLDVESLEVCIDIENGHENSCNGQTFMARVFQEATDLDLEIARLFISPAPCLSIVGARNNACSVRLVDDWQVHVKQSAHQIFPPIQELARATIPRNNALLKALKALEPSLLSGRRLPSVKPAARRAQRADAPGDDNGSDNSGSGTDDGDFDQDYYVALAAAGRVPAGGVGAGVGAPDDVADRQSRKHPWGPWTLSEVWAAGRHTGWGANCNCHFGSHLACKKNLAGGDDLNLARRLCKAWLLMGLRILPCSPTGREDHVYITRADIVDRSEDEMDLEAARHLRG